MMWLPCQRQGGLGGTRIAHLIHRFTSVPDFLIQTSVRVAAADSRDQRLQEFNRALREAFQAGRIFLFFKMFSSYPQLSTDHLSVAIFWLIMVKMMVYPPWYCWCNILQVDGLGGGTVSFFPTADLKDACGFIFNIPLYILDPLFLYFLFLT